MQSKESVFQRPLFADWPAWKQLPTDGRQQVGRLLANMCLEVVSSNKHSHDQEQSDEPSTDNDTPS